MGRRTDTTADTHRRGTVLLMVVFVVALMSTVVMGILQVDTEEAQLMQNHVALARAQAIAEAGLNDALAQLRLESTWNSGFTDKSFAGGSYTVTVDGHTITSTGITAEGVSVRLEADVSVDLGGPPYRIYIDAMRMNP